MNDKKSPGDGVGHDRTYGTINTGLCARRSVVCRRTKPYGGNNTDFTAAQSRELGGSELREIS
jgi:hypothetical protein